MDATESPCVTMCRIDERSGLCRGCRRTLEEIAQWPTYSQAERRAVLADLTDRKL